MLIGIREVFPDIFFLTNLMEKSIFLCTVLVFFLLFRATSASTSQSTGGMGTAERTFLTPKNTQTNLTANVPSLDEFDAEIEIYRVSCFSSCVKIERVFR